MKFLSHMLCILLGGLCVYIAMSQYADTVAIGTVISMGPLDKESGVAMQGSGQQGLKPHQESTAQIPLSQKSGDDGIAKLPEFARSVLRGRVVGQNGQPVAGAHVEVKLQHLVSGTGLSGADGGFEIGNLVDGFYRVEAIRDSMAGAVDLATLKSSVEVKLSPVSLVKVRCLDPSGNPLSAFNLAAFARHMTGLQDQYFFVADGDVLKLPMGKWKLQAQTNGLHSELVEFDSDHWSAADTLAFNLKEPNGVRFVIKDGGDCDEIKKSGRSFLLYQVSKGQKPLSGGSIMLNGGGYPALFDPVEQGDYEVCLTDFPWNKIVFEYKGVPLTVEIPVSLPGADNLIQLSMPKEAEEGLETWMSMAQADSFLEPCPWQRVGDNVGIAISMQIQQIWERGSSIILCAHHPKLGMAIAECMPGTRKVDLDFKRPAFLRVSMDAESQKLNFSVMTERIDGPPLISSQQSWHQHPMYKPDRSGVVELGPLHPGRCSIVVRQGEKIVRQQEILLSAGMNELGIQDINSLKEIQLVGCNPNEAIMVYPNKGVDGEALQADSQGRMTFMGEPDCGRWVIVSERGAMVLTQWPGQTLEFKPRAYTKLKLSPPGNANPDLKPFQVGDVIIGVEGKLLEDFGALYCILFWGSIPAKSLMIERGGKVMTVVLDDESNGNINGWTAGQYFRKFGVPID